MPPPPEEKASSSATARSETKGLTDRQLASVLDEIEDGIRQADPAELERHLGRLETVLHHLAAMHLTGDQTQLLTYTAMPKLVLMLLKQPVASEALCERINRFFQAVLKATIVMLRQTDTWELVESATRVLTDAATHHVYNRQRGDTSANGSPVLDSCSEGSNSDTSVDGREPSRGHGEASQYYLANIELFANLKGFEAILERIGRPPLVSLNAVRLMLRPFIKVKDLLPKPALQRLARSVHRTCMGHLEAISDELLKQEDRRSMTDLTRNLEVLLHSACLPDASRALDVFSLALSLKCLRAQNLEKRLSGISDVKEMINLSLRKLEYLEAMRERDAASGTSQLPPAADDWTTPELLVDWLQREQVVELIFGEGLHDQVVRRCVEVLCFLAMRGAFDSRMLELVWRASLDKHESVKTAIYMVLIDLTGHLPLPLLDELNEHIKSVPFAEYSAHTVVLLRGFAVSALQSANNPPKARRWYGLEEFWQLMQKSSPATAEVRTMSSNILADLLAWQQCSAQRPPFLTRCVQQLRVGESVPSALRLCQRVVASFPCKPRKKADSASSVLEWLDGQLELLAVFFDDFQRYHAAACTRLDALSDAAEAAMGGENAAAAGAELRAAHAEHMAQVSERLDFLSFATIHAPLSLSRSQLDVLWDCCVERASAASEADHLFRWLENCRVKAGALDTETTRHLFGRAAAMSLENLSPAGYSCIEYIFKWVNWKDGRFLQHDNSFTVLGLPLFGASALWDVAQRAADEQVGRRAVGLLTQLHHSLTPSLGDQLPLQRRAFVTSCMASLAASAAELRSLQQGAPAPQAAPAAAPGTRALSLSVERSLTLLRTFVEEIEAKRPADAVERSRRHGAAVRGVPMRVSVTVVGGSNSPKLEVTIDSSQTVAALRARVWRQLGSHDEWQPEEPAMLRMITAGRELKEGWKTLAELKLREPYGIHVMRRQHTAKQPPAPAPSAAQPMDADDADTPADGAAELGSPSDDGDGPSPAQLLADDAHFGTLFELLTLSDERLSGQAWALLMMLPTNKTMRSGLAALPNLQPPKSPHWPSLLHVGPSSYMLLYSLQIVDTLLAADTQAADEPAADGADASPWCTAFVAHGGLTHLLGLLLPTADGDDLLHARRGPQRKPCLVLLLRLLSHFLLASPSAAAEALPAGPADTPEVRPVPQVAADGASPPPPPPPVWAKRAFSPLIAADLAADARSAAFCRRLMALVARTAGADADAEPRGGSGALRIELPNAEGSDAALDVQIAREALQLLASAVLSERHALSALCEPSTLDAYLHTLLLGCANVEVRLEICAALHFLAADADATADRSELRAELLAALLRLLPKAEAANSSSRQYFELLQALLVAQGPQGLADGATSLCEGVASMLASHTVRERRDRPELVDQVLLGLLGLLRRLCPSLGAPARRALLTSTFGDLFSQPALADARALGADAPPKCKSAETRVCALSLLAEMCEGGGADDALRSELVELLLSLHEQRGGGAPRTLWHYMPSAMEKSRCGYVGLKNLGATCYLNALVQQLFLVPEFRNGILELPVAETPPSPPEKGSAAPNKALLSQLQHMFGYLHESEKKYFDTRDLCNAFRDSEHLPINPSIQMDAEEFLGQLFEQLETACKETSASRLLQGLFGGTSVNQIVSREKGLLSEREEIFYTVAIDIKGKRSILDGLSAFVEGEVLDGDNKYKCDSGEYVEAVKRTCLASKLPPVLILHLKRFEFDFEAMKKMKVNDLCEFPHKINMRPYTVDALAPTSAPATPDGEGDGEGDGGAEGAAAANGPPSPPAGGAAGDAAASASALADEAAALAAGQLYELVGVLVHSGIADSGHYYSYIRERRTSHGAPEGKSASGSGWLHFNDTLVEPFDERDIPTCCYGGVEPIAQWDAELQKHVQRMAPKPHSAYMLFYEKVRPPDASEAAAAAAAAETAAKAAAAAAEAAAAEPKPADPNHDAHRGSTVLLAEPRPADVPERIVASVWEENMQFLRDRLVFDAAHFAFVRRVVAGALPPPPPPRAESPLLELSEVAACAEGGADGEVDGAVEAIVVEATAVESADGDDAAGAIEGQVADDALAEPPSLAELAEGGPLPMRALQLGCRFLVETMAHAKDKGSLPAWLSLLQDGLKPCLPACRWLLLEAVSAGWLRQILLICTVAEMRNAFATLLLHAMRCLRPSELRLYAVDAPSLPPPLDAPMDGVPLPKEEVSSSSTTTSDSEHHMDVDPPAPTAADGRRAATRRPAGPSLPPQTSPRRPAPPRAGGDGVVWTPPPPAAPAAAVRVVESLLTMVPEAPSHWRHFPQFFLVLLDFARLGAEERRLLLKRRVVTLLVDFYLGDESPLADDDVASHHRPKRIRMGDKFTLPNLDHMVELVSTLVLSSSRSAELSPSTPYSVLPLLVMTPDEQSLATCAPFLQKVLKEGLNVKALERLLLHVCYDNQQASVAAMHIVLQGIDTMDSDALGPYLSVFAALIALEDGMQASRVNMAMTKLLRVIAANMRFKLATIACLRMVMGLASNAMARNWLLSHHDEWLQEWLICGLGENVRSVAEQLVCTLIAADIAAHEADIAAAAAAAAGPEAAAAGVPAIGPALPPGSAPAAPPTAAAPPAEQAPSLRVIYDYMLTLLGAVAEMAKDLGPERDPATGKPMLDDVPPPRLMPYWRVLAWCVRKGGMPSVDVSALSRCYDVQDGHHWECDETKRQLLRYWHLAARAPQGVAACSPLVLATQPQTFRRLLDSFVSLRPSERHLRYNREMLPHFYGLIHAALHSQRSPRPCLQQLASHRNWEWAIRYILVESADYVNLLATPAAGEEEPALAPTLLELLRPCCASFPTFRTAVLSSMLESAKLAYTAPNILVLLEMLTADEERKDERRLVCEKGNLPALLAIAEGQPARTLLDCGAWGHLELLFQIIARVVGVVAALKLNDERRRRMLEAWGFGGSASRSVPLLHTVFASLNLGSSHAPKEEGPQPAAAPPSPPQSLRKACHDLSCKLATVDQRSAELTLRYLLGHHTKPRQAPPTDAELANASTLAGLPGPAAVQLASSRGADFGDVHYHFISTLLYASLNSHATDPPVVNAAMQLSLALAKETLPLPISCERFLKLLKQLVDLKDHGHLMRRTLIAELASSEHELVSAICNDHHLLASKASAAAFAAITALVHASPPTDAWHRRLAERIEKARQAMPAEEARHAEALAAGLEALEAGFAPLAPL